MVAIFNLFLIVPAVRSFLGGSVVGRSAPGGDVGVQAPISLEVTPEVGMLGLVKGPAQSPHREKGSDRALL